MPLTLLFHVYHFPFHPLPFFPSPFTPCFTPFSPCCCLLSCLSFQHFNALLLLLYYSNYHRANVRSGARARFVRSSKMQFFLTKSNTTEWMLRFQRWSWWQLRPCRSVSSLVEAYQGWVLGSLCRMVNWFVLRLIQRWLCMLGKKQREATQIRSKRLCFKLILDIISLEYIWYS